MNSYYRGRRSRHSRGLRQLVEETKLSPTDLIQPYFVTDGSQMKEPIQSMQGQYRWSQDTILYEVESLLNSGLNSLVLFGVLDDARKDDKASVASSETSSVAETVKSIKARFPEMTLITDVCLCGYTDHGHCGVLDESGHVANDESLPILANMALAHARAGADVVAPSDMMDGRVAIIRSVLDEEGFQHVPILSYAAKYASQFYGPFRDAANSGMKKGEKSRSGYQMDPANAREALREVAADIDEGADMVMVKPALAYLDVIKAVRETFAVPTFAYSVSGEYSMIKAAAEKGWVDEKAIALETLLAIKRAGADRILTYFAKEASSWLTEAK